MIGYHREFDVGAMNFCVHWPGMDPQYTLETIRLFGEKVILEIKRIVGEDDMLAQTRRVRMLIIGGSGQT